LVGDQVAEEYFGVYSSTGGLYIKKDLRTTDRTVFTAEVKATDGGGKNRLGELVTIVISSDGRK